MERSPRTPAFWSIPAALRVRMKCLVSPNGPVRALIVGKTSRAGKPNDVRNVPIMHALGEQPSGRVGLLAVTRVHNARRLRVPDREVDRALRTARSSPIWIESAHRRILFHLRAVCYTSHLTDVAFSPCWTCRYRTPIITIAPSSSWRLANTAAEIQELEVAIWIPLKYLTAAWPPGASLGHTDRRRSNR